jgi:hypothetical protein
MAQSKFFELITGDENLIIEVINDFNIKYETDFELVNFEDKDGVIFAKVKYEKSTINDIFQLGCIFGMKIHKKRNLGEIDW